MLRLYNLAKAFTQRPSVIAGVMEEYGDLVAYQFDQAVLFIGRRVESALDKNGAQKKERRLPKNDVISRALGEGDALPWEQFADVSSLPGVKTVKAKPGEDWFTAIRRAEQEGLI